MRLFLKNRLYSLEYLHICIYIFLFRKRKNQKLKTLRVSDNPKKAIQFWKIV